MAARTADTTALDVLVGEWSLGIPGQEPLGRSTFEWILGGSHLAQRTVAPDPGIPDSLAVVAAAAGEPGRYTQHYFDSRGVTRVYAMTFVGRHWTLLRATPDFSPLDFHQRFTAEVGDDGDSVRGTWETSADGVTWERDFDLVYLRAAR